LTDHLILVINSGSSSLKFALHAPSGRQPLLSGLADRLGQAEATLSIRQASDIATRTLPQPTHAAALDALLAELSQRDRLHAVGAVGHRVVHGGERFTRSVVITPEVLADLEACSPLAPLHNPPALLAIRTAMEKLPHLPHVAVLDTAFTRPCRLRRISTACRCHCTGSCMSAATASTAPATASWPPKPCACSGWTRPTTG
jgi:acetate kinase